MDCRVNILAVSVMDVPSVEYLSLYKRIVREKCVGIDSGRLLLTGRQQEPHHEFVRGFRRHNVPLLGETNYLSETQAACLVRSVLRPRLERPAET